MDSKGISTLIIVLIVAVVIVIATLPLLAQFLGITGCIIPIGCGGEANVLVIGTPSSDVVMTLSSQEARLKGINYPINFNPDYITSKTLENYNVVILQGDPYFDMTTREAIGNYVKGGGMLIVVGDAGSKHPEYANVAGWGWPSGQGIPVPAELVGAWAGWSDVAYGAELIIEDQNHPISKGLKIIGTQLTTVSQVFKVTSRGDGIAAIRTSEGTVPAIIEGGSGLGTVVYFSYDPGQTPGILLTTIAYLAGI